MDKDLRISQEALFILDTLKKAGFDAYIVGGAVRDLVRGLSTADYDFTTNATPEQLLALFPESFYENTFGTVSIAPKHLREMMGLPPLEEKSPSETPPKTIDLSSASKVHESLQLPTFSTPEMYNDSNFEITTYRSEGKYEDHRRPTEITWGKSIEEDLSRRDFTMNAMALTLDDQDNPHILDPYHGQKDLEHHFIRTVGDPAERFAEDALRMLRAVRFSVQLNMQMTDEIFAAISELAADITHVSWERIRDEFFKMLKSEYPAEAIELLEETGLLHYILPELREGQGVDQAGHHTTDVWTHSLDALRNCPSPDPIVRFATLLHDIAKPRTFRIDDAGKITFYNHEIIGARIAKQIAQRFRLSKRDVDRIFALVRYHMFYYQPHNTDAAIRRFMRKVGLENVNDILDLREGDRLGSGARKTSWRLEEMKQRMIEQLHQPFAVTDLAIDGNDLMETYGLKPGPQIGQILQTLFEKVLDQPELNERETLLDEAKKVLNEHPDAD